VQPTELADHDGLLSCSLKQRCASPLILCNDRLPQYSQSSSPRPGFAERQRMFENLSSANRNKNLNEPDHLPKRTVSLGPRRQVPIHDHLASASHERNLADRQRSFNTMAKELQSSIDELNNLIDKPQSASISRGPPKFSSYITNNTTETRANYAQKLNNTPTVSLRNDFHLEPPEKSSYTTWKVEEDLAEWKASGSINDLRSAFESKLKATQNSGPQINQRPPRSASPSNFRNSPWQISDSPQASQLAPDYTIRRTISTSSKSPVRSPYRSHYKEY